MTLFAPITFRLPRKFSSLIGRIYIANQNARLRILALKRYGTQILPGVTSRMMSQVAGLKDRVTKSRGTSNRSKIGYQKFDDKNSYYRKNGGAVTAPAPTHLHQHYRFSFFPIDELQCNDSDRECVSVERQRHTHAPMAVEQTTIQKCIFACCPTETVGRWGGGGVQAAITVGTLVSLCPTPIVNCLLRMAFAIFAIGA